MKPLPPPQWLLPDARTLPEGVDYAGSGMDWDDATLLNAYAAGYFPMPRTLEADAIDWWSPDPRAVLDPAAMRISRSLRQSLKRFTITVNAAFDDVVFRCADPARDSRWIDASVRIAYGTLHRSGWAHSIEVWHDGALAGGLYGVEIGGLFAGESMFHVTRDASKAALVGLVTILQSAPGPRRIDCQWLTAHLASLGAVEIRRAQYVEELPRFLGNDEILASLPRGARL